MLLTNRHPKQLRPVAGRMKPPLLALAGSICIAAGIVYYVHFKQVDDRVQMRKGVDAERMRDQAKDNGS